MIWFLADLHFYHTGVLDYSKRPFASVEQMHEFLVYNINSVVKKSDTAYHLGDFCMGNAERKIEMFSKLQGQWHMILGNHDSGLENALKRKFKLGKGRLASISQYKMIHVDTGTNPKQGIFLSHYATRTWPEMHYGAWHLHGHSHGGLPEYQVIVKNENGESVQKRLKCMDVGVDAVNPQYFPISLTEVCNAMKVKDDFNVNMLPILGTN